MKFSIIVINSIPPYAYELNNILALPNGFNYRFRFQYRRNQKWMPKIDDPKELEHTDGLIVLRDFQISASFFPIRLITITDVKRIGEVVYIEFSLKSRIIYNSIPEKRKEQLELFNKRITADIEVDKYPNQPQKDLSNLVFFGTNYTHDFVDDIQLSGDEAEYNKWGNTIEAIGKHNGQKSIFIDIDFLNLIGIFDANGKKVNFIEKRSHKYFRLNNKREYTLKFFQRTYTGISNEGNSAVITPRKGILRSGSEDIKIIRSYADVLGKYDILEFPFSVKKSSNESLKTFLYFEIDSRDDKRIPSIHIPVFITPSLKSLITSTLIIGLFIGAFFLYWYSDAIVELIFQGQEGIDISKYSSNLKNILLPALILLGSNTVVKLNNLKEFILGRIYL